jgi:hypothetical protein
MLQQRPVGQCRTAYRPGHPDTTPPDQHRYRNTDVLAADRGGHWHVVSVYPVIYYPQAKECTA